LVRELRGMNITPHVAQNNTNRRSAVDQRTTRHAGYEISQRKREYVRAIELNPSDAYGHFFYSNSFLSPL
jgi:hypothetical protein